MGRVVALRPTVIEAAGAIAVKMAQAENATEKASSLRVEAGRMLLALRERVEAGEAGDVQWWQWIRDRICTKTKRDMEKCMALARSQNPAAAAEQERTKARVGMKAQRARAANVSRTQRSQDKPSQPQVTPFDIVFRAYDLVERMNKNERKRFFAKLKEGYPNEI